MTWQDYPHFFATDAFRFVFKNDKKEIHREIEGVDTDGKIGLWLDEEPNSLHNLVWSFPDELILVARKIESLTNEELTEMVGGATYSRGYALTVLKGQAVTGDMWSKHFLYLLSVGVYPLDPEHFHSGYVLEREEI